MINAGVEEREIINDILARAIKLCADIPQFQVGIVISHYGRRVWDLASYIYHTAIDNIDSENLTLPRTGARIFRSGELLWPNGSCVSVVPGILSSRGYKFNFIICDNTLPQVIKEMCTYSMLMPLFTSPIITDYMEVVECAI